MKEVIQMAIPVPASYHYSRYMHCPTINSQTLLPIANHNITLARKTTEKRVKTYM